MLKPRIRVEYVEPLTYERSYYKIFPYRTAQWQTVYELPEYLQKQYLILRMVDVGVEVPGVGQRTGDNTFDIVEE